MSTDSGRFPLEYSAPAWVPADTSAALDPSGWAVPEAVVAAPDASPETGADASPARDEGSADLPGWWADLRVDPDGAVPDVVELDRAGSDEPPDGRAVLDEPAQVEPAQVKPPQGRGGVGGRHAGGGSAAPPRPAAAEGSRVVVGPGRVRGTHPAGGPALWLPGETGAFDLTEVRNGWSDVGPDEGLEPVQVAAAAAFAARFAADYYSFDEDDPDRRRAALAGYVAEGWMAEAGWDGTGRQLAVSPVTGRTTRTLEGVVLVEVWVRAFSYRRHPATPAAPPRPGSAGSRPPAVRSDSLVGHQPRFPSAAPDPAAPGWVRESVEWLPIAPPVRRDRTGRLVVDLAAFPH